MSSGSKNRANNVRCGFYLPFVNDLCKAINAILEEKYFLYKKLYHFILLCLLHILFLGLHILFAL